MVAGPPKRGIWLPPSGWFKRRFFFAGFDFDFAAKGVVLSRARDLA
jgi:hypothetical protein